MFQDYFSLIIAVALAVWVACGLCFITRRLGEFRSQKRPEPGLILWLLFYAYGALLGPLAWLYRWADAGYERFVSWRSKKRDQRKARIRDIYLNQPVELVFNSHPSGIFAFMREEDFDRACEQHDRALKCGSNTHTSVTEGISHTIVFASQKAKDRYRDGRYISGGMDQVNSIVGNPRVSVRRDKRLFVPLVNALVLPYDEQWSLLTTRVGSGDRRDFTDAVMNFLTEHVLPDHLN